MTSPPATSGNQVAGRGSAGHLVRRVSQTHHQQVKFREVLRLIEDDGWRLVAHRGSHRQYEHPTKPGKVTVAGKPGADVPKGTEANIPRQAGLRRPD